MLYFKQIIQNQVKKDTLRFFAIAQNHLIICHSEGFSLKKLLCIILVFFISFFSINLIFAKELIIRKQGITAYYDKKGNLYKIEEDTNKNGKIDTIKFIKNKRVSKIFQDENNDNYFETKIFLNNAQIEKMLKDNNKDKKIDEKIFYKNGVIDKILLDTDYNGSFDTVKYFKKGKLFKEKKGDKVVFFLKKNKTKLIKNGNEFYYVNKKIKKAVIYKKGKKYRIILFKNSKKYIEKIDKNLDGFFEITVKYENGKIIEKEEYKKYCKYPFKVQKKNNLFIDNNCNNIFEKKIFIKGKEKIVKIDTNENGKVDIEKIFYNNKLKTIKKKYETIYFKNGQITKIEQDSNFDGKIDIIKYYNNGKLIKTKKDLNFDGKFDFEE